MGRSNETGRELAVRAVGLRHAYPIRLGLARRAVLHGLDFELERGASLGLVGPNGSGKSTLLRVLAGVEGAHGGTLEVLGGSLADASVRRRVGYLPEESPYPRELSARAMLLLLAAAHGMSRAVARARAGALLERVGLAANARTALGRFSRGMLRRFGFAATVLAEPELVLLDEPTAGLDAPGFAVLDELLSEARARGAALIVASHLLTDIQAHCERLLVLVDGRAVLQGTPGDLERGSVALEIDGLAPERIAALEESVRAQGGRVVERRASERGLVELYRRAARRDAP